MFFLERILREVARVLRCGLFILGVLLPLRYLLMTDSEMPDVVDNSLEVELVSFRYLFNISLNCILSPKGIIL